MLVQDTFRVSIRGKIGEKKLNKISKLLKFKPFAKIILLDTMKITK